MSTCFYCNQPIDPASQNVWRRVVGWERKAQAATRKSGSDIALREPRDEYAHNACVTLAKDGISPAQETLI